MFNIILLIASLSSFILVDANTCAGCLELDDLTFDKVISKFSTVLVKFDIAYPYGDKHEAYAKLASEGANQHDDFAVAVVGIKDYGDKENTKLGERFEVGDKYPVIKLFRNGNADNWIDFDSDITTDNLRQFVRRHSNVYLALKGCLQQFDGLAADFVKTAQFDTSQLNQKIAKAEEEIAKLEKETDKENAQIYVLFMKRIEQKGLEFVTTEKYRLQNLLSGKISANKKLELNQKLNILSAFNFDEKTIIKNEL